MLDSLSQACLCSLLTHSGSPLFIPARYLLFRGYVPGCPLSTCGRNTLELAEVQLFAITGARNLISAAASVATSDTTMVRQGGFRP